MGEKKATEINFCGQYYSGGGQEGVNLTGILFTGVDN